MEDIKVLLLRAKSGDKDAFGQAYQAYFAPIFRYLYFRLKDKQEAQDLTQTVFIKVFKNLDDYRIQGQPLAYFFTVARNTLIDYQRKKKEVKIEDEEKIEEVQNQEELMQSQFLWQKIMAVFPNLPEDQQEIMTLKFINHLSNQEISEITGKSLGNIRQIQCRAIAKIKELTQN